MTYQTAKEFDDNKIATELKERAAEAAADQNAEQQVAQREQALVSTAGTGLIPVGQNTVAIGAPQAIEPQVTEPQTELLSAIKQALGGHGYPQLEALVSPHTVK